MGVHQLYTFLSEVVPNGLFEINLFDEVEKYKRNNPEKTPVIIIDMLSLRVRIFESGHEILLGGRYNIYNQRAQKIFDRLNELGAKIMYFCDGPTQSDKIETALERKNSDYNRCFKAFNIIDANIDFSDNKTKGFRVKPTAFTQNYIEIAKANTKNKLHISCLNECDQEMVDCANQLEALAIMSDDTDFLIFQGNWKFWSTNNINFRTMTTLEYNKSALRSELSLSSEQMSLLGTLAGNDFFKYEMVDEYHKRLGEQAGGKFYGIANYIKSMTSLPPRLNNDDENYIMNNILQTNNRSQGLTDLRSNLNWYFCKNMKRTFKNQTQDVVAKDTNNFNYIILSNKDDILNLNYFDLSLNDFMPFYELIKPIIRRTMGILLFHKKSEQHIHKFYCKFKHDKPYESINETPEYPTINNMPSLVKFLYHPYGEDKNLDQLRWKMFCWIISPKLNPEMILEIPKENLLTIITIFYLVEKNQITVEEGDCILLASNIDEELSRSLNIMHMKRVNGRDARISFLFPRIFNMVYYGLSGSGLSAFSSLIKFDGLYFHMLRQKYRNNCSQYVKIRIEKYQKIRIYNRFMQQASPESSLKKISTQRYADSDRKRPTSDRLYEPPPPSKFNTTIARSEKRRDDYSSSKRDDYTSGSSSSKRDDYKRDIDVSSSSRHNYSSGGYHSRNDSSSYKSRYTEPESRSSFRRDETRSDSRSSGTKRYETSSYSDRPSTGTSSQWRNSSSGISTMKLFSNSISSSNQPNWLSKSSGEPWNPPGKTTQDRYKRTYNVGKPQDRYGAPISSSRYENGKY